MLLDANLQFSNAQAITASAASYVYDQATGLMLTGSTYTAASALTINWGKSTYFGEDLGIGAVTPRAVVSTGTTNFGTGTSLQISFQGAPDNGGTTLSGLTWSDFMMTAAIPLATLLKNTRIASFDWPMRQSGIGLPRFVRLYYTVAGSNFTTATVNSDVSIFGDDSQSTMAQYPNNFTVAA